MVEALSCTCTVRLYNLVICFPTFIVRTVLEATNYYIEGWFQQMTAYSTDYETERNLPIALRLLQQSNTTSSATTTTSGNDGAILRATFVVYGSFILGMFITFCHVRRKFPRAYHLRNWVVDIKVRQKVQLFSLKFSIK